MTHLLVQHGLIILFALVAMESAGVPLPGETALIAAAILASQHHYSIVSVIVVAAVVITASNWAIRSCKASCCAACCSAVSSCA